MPSFLSGPLILSLIAAIANGRDIPPNVQDFYNSIVAQGECSKPSASGFFSIQGDAGDSVYCADHLDDYGVVYLQGTGGKLVNMDIDCDGIQGGPADDGRCGSSADTQDITAFQSTVQGYGTGQKDLDANADPYVVFGNTGGKNKGWPSYNPKNDGVEPLSVMAVVCGDKLIYGVWGDENGADGPEPMVGEASISLATACFGDSMNGNNGHDGNDVLYIAFTGTDAVPGASGADWTAASYDDFEASILDLGNTLVQRIGSNSTSGGGGSCAWAGHCAGASCGADSDCSGQLVCINGICAASGGSTSCSWAGHCQGASCGTDDDCSDDLVCTGGVCSNS